MEHRPWGVYRDIRFDGIAAGAPDPAVVSVDAIGFEAVERYDRLHVPAPRHAFLRRWIDQPGAHSVVVNEGGEVVGTASPVRVGADSGSRRCLPTGRIWLSESLRTS